MGKVVRSAVGLLFLLLLCSPALAYSVEKVWVEWQGEQVSTLRPDGSLQDAIVVFQLSSDVQACVAGTQSGECRLRFNAAALSRDAVSQAALRDGRIDLRSCMANDAKYLCKSPPFVLASTSSTVSVAYVLDVGTTGVARGNATLSITPDATSPSVSAIETGYCNEGICYAAANVPTPVKVTFNDTVTSYKFGLVFVGAEGRQSQTRLRNCTGNTCTGSLIFACTDGERLQLQVRDLAGVPTQEDAMNPAVIGEPLTVVCRTASPRITEWRAPVANGIAGQAVSGGSIMYAAMVESALPLTGIALSDGATPSNATSSSCTDQGSNRYLCTFVLTPLNAGKFTVTFTIADMAGNLASRSASLTVLNLTSSTRSVEAFAITPTKVMPESLNRMSLDLARASAMPYPAYVTYTISRRNPQMRVVRQELKSCLYKLPNETNYTGAYNLFSFGGTPVESRVLYADQDFDKPNQLSLQIRADRTVLRKSDVFDVRCRVDLAVAEGNSIYSVPQSVNVSFKVTLRDATLGQPGQAIVDKIKAESDSINGSAARFVRRAEQAVTALDKICQGYETIYQIQRIGATLQGVGAGMCGGPLAAIGNSLVTTGGTVVDSARKPLDWGWESPRFTGVKQLQTFQQSSLNQFTGVVAPNNMLVGSGGPIKTMCRQVNCRVYADLTKVQQQTASGDIRDIYVQQNPNMVGANADRLKDLLPDSVTGNAVVATGNGIIDTAVPQSSPYLFPIDQINAQLEISRLNHYQVGKNDFVVRQNNGKVQFLKVTPDGKIDYNTLLENPAYAQTWQKMASSFQGKKTAAVSAAKNIPAVTKPAPPKVPSVLPVSTTAGAAQLPSGTPPSSTIPSVPDWMIPQIDTSDKYAIASSSWLWSMCNGGDSQACGHLSSAEMLRSCTDGNAIGCQQAAARCVSDSSDACSQFLQMQRVIGPQPSYAEFARQAAVNRIFSQTNLADPSTLVGASSMMCFGGVVHALQKKQAIDCGYLTCLKEQSASGSNIAVCEQSRAYAQCMFVAGEASELPLARTINNMMRNINNMIQNAPAVVADLSLDYVCRDALLPGGAGQGCAVNPKAIGCRIRSSFLGMKDVQQQVVNAYAGLNVQDRKYYADTCGQAQGLNLNINSGASQIGQQVAGQLGAQQLFNSVGSVLNLAATTRDIDARRQSAALNNIGATPYDQLDLNSLSALPGTRELPVRYELTGNGLAAVFVQNNVETKVDVDVPAGVNPVLAANPSYLLIERSGLSSLVTVTDAITGATIVDPERVARLREAINGNNLILATFKDTALAGKIAQDARTIVTCTGTSCPVQTANVIKHGASAAVVSGPCKGAACQSACAQKTCLTKDGVQKATAADGEELFVVVTELDKDDIELLSRTYSVGRTAQYSEAIGMVTDYVAKMLLDRGYLDFLTLNGLGIQSTPLDQNRWKQSLCAATNDIRDNDAGTITDIGDTRNYLAAKPAATFGAEIAKITNESGQSYMYVASAYIANPDRKNERRNFDYTFEIVLTELQSCTSRSCPATVSLTNGSKLALPMGVNFANGNLPRTSITYLPGMYGKICVRFDHRYPDPSSGQVQYCRTVQEQAFRTGSPAVTGAVQVQAVASAGGWS